MKIAAIVDRLEQLIGIDGIPRPLIDAIVSDGQANGGLLEIQAIERAENIRLSVTGEIRKRAQIADDTGRSTILTIVGVTSDMVAGFCHVLNTDHPQIAEAKRQRRQVQALSDAIRKLSFNDFELFGARVLAAIGASNAKITPHSGDQGIDFFGQLSLGQFQSVPLPFVRLSHDVVFSFMGQAKHYPTRALGPETVRELVGAVSLARTKTFSAENDDLFPGLILKPFSPVVIFLFTTGRLSKGATKLAEAAGIIARSGDQLATFLADKGVGTVNGPSGPTFDHQTFLEWLHPS